MQKNTKNQSITLINGVDDHSLDIILDLLKLDEYDQQYISGEILVLLRESKYRRAHIKIVDLNNQNKDNN